MPNKIDQKQPVVSWFEKKLQRLSRWVLDIDRGWKANLVALLIVFAVSLGVDVPW